MSKTYQLKQGDDIREIRLKLTSTIDPVAAVLIIKNGGTRIERNLIQDGLEWTYRFTDNDFIALAPGRYQAEVYATFEDGTNGTYPTVSTLIVQVFAKL